MTASAGIAGWVEFALLRNALNRRIGTTGVPLELVARLWGSAALGAAAGWAIKWRIGAQKPLLSAVAVLIPYGLVYFAAAYALRVEECASLFRRLNRLR